MPMNKITINNQVISGGMTVITKQTVLECDLEQNFSFEIPVGASGARVELPIADITRLKLIAIGAKRTQGEDSALTVALNIGTNSATSPTDNWNVTATNGLCWSIGDPTAMPVTANVTSFFVTNNGTSKVDLVIKLGYDSTPTLP